MQRRLFILALAAGLSGCLPAAPQNYWRVAAIPGPVLSGPARRIAVRSIGLPGYLDQNNLIRPGPAYQVATFDNDLWAAPLAGQLQSVLVQDLAQRLPDATILASGGAIQAPPDIFVEISVLRFDPDPSGAITLSAQIGIRPASSAAFQTFTFAQTATPAAAGAGESAATMSALWGAAANAIAERLRAA
jgi:uncharacterized lipoprotein YmbA